jgi:predicted HicB family RNase H-like nuclease
MKHKGYTGVATFDEEADIFHGEVINTRDVITFQGTSVKELRKAFRDSVDDYLAFCAERGESPEKPFSGSFVVRIPSAVHGAVAARAQSEGKSLNAYVAELLAVWAHSQGRRGTAATKERRHGRRSVISASA